MGHKKKADIKNPSRESNKGPSCTVVDIFIPYSQQCLLIAQYTKCNTFICFIAPASLTVSPAGWLADGVCQSHDVTPGNRFSQNRGSSIFYHPPK